VTKDQILKYIESELNSRGEEFGLAFKVAKQTRVDGEWLQVFVSSNVTRRNGAAERQLIADVEEEATKKSRREILILPTRIAKTSA
jgi:hypothetical protein